MIKRVVLRAITLSIIFCLVAPMSFSDAKSKKVTVVHKTVTIKNSAPKKKVPTLNITKKWYRPRSRPTKYQAQRLTGKNANYSGREIVAEKGTQYYLRRYGFLIDGASRGGYHHIRFIGRHAEPQGVAIVHGKLYIQMTYKHTKKYLRKHRGAQNRRKGRIIKYNLSMLNSIVNKGGKHNKIVLALQKSKKYLYTMHNKKSTRNKRKKLAKKHLSATNYKIYSAVTFGPMYQAGHGQSFAYNAKKKSLYNASYRLASDHDSRSRHPFSLQKISLSKLRPVKVWRLNIRMLRYEYNGGNVKAYRYLQMHDLTFDGSNKFYFTQMYGGKQRPKNRMKMYTKRVNGKKFIPDQNFYRGFNKSVGKSAYIYKGYLTGKSAHIKLIQKVSNSLGSVSQGLSYGKTKEGSRIFIVYDNAYMSFPIKKLGHKISQKQVNFTVLSSKFHRESEGMGITAQGHGYLIMNRIAEAARTNRTVN
ncbi:hypothetical protein D8911_11085 [Levilactobacillus brevis]|nr:hypothetical protein D8911_11085 [Levilactobacillus brevis]